MVSTQESWIRKYEDAGALWIHDGNPARPHALLTKGGHSDGFFNSELVFQNPILAMEGAGELLSQLIRSCPEFDIAQPEVVAGVAMGAVEMSFALAWHIGRMRKINCRRVYAEKNGEGESKEIVFKRNEITPHEQVLMVEDVCTTGSTIGSLAHLLVSARATILPYVLALVNRSGQPQIGGRKVISLIDRRLSVWPADDCPLCEKGSVAIRPKQEGNWARLNAEY